MRLTDRVAFTVPYMAYGFNDVKGINGEPFLTGVIRRLLHDAMEHVGATVVDRSLPFALDDKSASAQPFALRV